jgi:hypothetical protein
VFNTVAGVQDYSLPAPHGEVHFVAALQPYWGDIEGKVSDMYEL